MMQERALFLVVAVAAYCTSTSVASICLSNPCDNGGTCMDLGVAFVCICPVQYRGMTCEIIVNPCQPSPCQNGALCFRRSGTVGAPYRCICSGLFTGPNCDTPTTPCSPDPCLNGGECRVINDVNYQCQCTGGYQGINCETYVSTALAAIDSGSVVLSPCEASPCSNGGFCMVSERDASQYICRCLADFGGRNCEKMPCEMNPCTNGGDCFSSYRLDGTYMCRCPKGHKGKNCEISDACSGNPCGEGNLCLDGEDGGFSCLCPCSPGSTCNSSPDSNNGSDVSGGDNTGSGGDNTGSGGDNTGNGGDSGTVDGGDNNVGNIVANTNIFRCVRMMKATFNCSQHGECLVRDSTAICRCHDGYMGVACQDPTPNSNSGTETRPISSGGSGSTGSSGSSGGSGSTGGSGVIVDDSMGYRCVRMMDSTHQCMGHGYCVVDQETAICQCDRGYMGVACEDETGETVNNVEGDSESGSTDGSTSGSNNNVNTAQSTYLCTRMMRASSECMGHGFCLMSSGTAVCRCNNGYKGVICEVEIDNDENGVSNSGTVDGGSTSGTAAGGSSSGTAAGGSTSGTAAGGSTSGTAAGGSTSGTAAGGSTSGTAAGGSTSGTVGGGSSSGTVGGASNSVSGSVALANDVNCARMMGVTNNCNGRGQCVVSRDTAICYCYQGYKGVVCQEEI